MYVWIDHPHWEHVAGFSIIAGVEELEEEKKVLAAPARGSKSRTKKAQGRAMGAITSYQLL